MGKRKSILEGGSNVTLDNVRRFCGDSTARHRKDNGRYAKDSDYEFNPLDY